MPGDRGAELLPGRGLLLVIGWRLSWLTTRVDRADARAERTWAALDAVLARRAQWAQWAARLVSSPGVDPVTALLVTAAAAAALEPDLSRPERERAESDLSHGLAAVAPGLEPRLAVWPPAAGSGAAYDVGPITLRALPPPTGDQYARPASMRSIAARPAPPAPFAQRAGKP